jgi:cell wall-associated NlpC family hydrolase
MSENIREKVVSIARDLIGTPTQKYVHGHPDRGMSPEDGFNCSGFVTYVLNEAGLHIPQYMGMDGELRDIRHANEFFEHYGFMVHEENVRNGDLVFFSKTGEFVTHMGIVASDTTYIHASSKRKFVKETKITNEEINNPDGEYHMYSHNPIGYKSLALKHDEPNYRYHQKFVD